MKTYRVLVKCGIWQTIAASRYDVADGFFWFRDAQSNIVACVSTSELSLLTVIEPLKG